MLKLSLDKASSPSGTFLPLCRLNPHEESQRNAQSPTPEQRDHWYRKLLNQLTLSLTDRADLQRRGLTDAQIDAGLFRSVEQWQALKPELPFGLPGVSLDGRSLNTQAGYLCPIVDIDGRIVAFQVRLRDADQGGRYRWLSSKTKKRPNGPTAHLPNGENPITVARPIDEIKIKTIGMAEGILKPFITAQQLGQVIIGAAGGQFASSPETLQETLERLSEELGIKTIAFYPDAGSPENRGILHQYQATWALLEEWGYAIQVAWWGQTTKDAADIDELTDQNQIKWLTVSAFEAITTPNAPKRKTKAEQFRDEVDYWQGWLNRLDLEPATVISDRYLPAGKLPEPGSILLVDAPTGTGKTSSYCKGLLDDQAAIAPDGKFIMLGSRNVLQFQTMNVYKGRHHSQYASCAEMLSDRWWVGCYDSIFKFDPARITKGSILFLDEISSGFKHLLVGSTLKEMRVFAIRRLAEICRVVIRKGGWIVGSVDNLTNVELGLLRDIVDEHVPVSLTQSKWKREPWEIAVFDSPSQTWGKLHEHFADSLMYTDETCQPIIAASDSAKWLRETERFLVKEVGLPQEKVWILDADSSPEPWAKAFADNPDKWLRTHQPLFFGYSPTLESGVSITAKSEDGSPYFAAMAVHLVGVLEPRDAVQLPARYRLPVPRFGYIKEFATKDDGCRSQHPEVILRDLRRNTAGIAVFTQIAEQLTKEQTSFTDEDAPDLVGTLTRLLSDESDSKETFWLKHYSRIVARENGGKARLRADIIERWEAKGHNVSLELLGADTHFAAYRRRIRGQLDSEEAASFAGDDVSQMTLEDARDILDRFGASKDERRQAKKRLLVERLPGCPLDAVEFVHKTIVQDNGKFLKTAELLWSYQHPDWQQQIDRLNLFGKIKRAATRKEWLYAADVRSRGYQAELMARSPLDDCLNDEWYSDDSPYVVKFKAWALWNRVEVYRVLRLNVHEDQSGTAILNKFLRKLGFDMASKRPGKRGEDRPRIYRIKNLEDCDRDAILTALTAKFQASALPVSNICSLERTLQNLDTEPPEEHTEDDLWMTEAELDNIRAMWEADDSSEARRELLKVIPLTALERAIPSDELRKITA